MSAYLVCLLALLVGALAPTVWLTVHGSAANRLVGLQLTGPVATVCVLLLSVSGPGQPYELELALVLVALSFAGTLVFTRLLGYPQDGEGE